MELFEKLNKPIKILKQYTEHTKDIFDIKFDNDTTLICRVNIIPAICLVMSITRTSAHMVLAKFIEDTHTPNRNVQSWEETCEIM